MLTKHCCVLHSFIFLCTAPFPALAEAAQETPIPPSSIIAPDSMTKMITGLLLVLAIIIAITWLLKRFAIIPSTATGNLKIVAATGVGQRERVVIVEIGETWLVLGVAPGQVSKLHSMERSSLDATNNTVKKTTSQFAETLDKSINKSTKP